MNVILCRNSPMSCKHEALLKCFQANLKHLKHGLLQTHMWKIFDVHTIVISAYEHTLPIHYILSAKYNVNGMSLYKSFDNKKSPYHILHLFGL